METFAAVVLICSLATAPRDCNETTAIRYDKTVGEWAIPLQCMAEGQQHHAELAAKEPRLWNTDLEGSTAYPKVSCIRHDFGGKNRG